VNTEIYECSGKVYACQNQLYFQHNIKKRYQVFEVSVRLFSSYIYKE